MPQLFADRAMGWNFITSRFFLDINAFKLAS